MVSTETDQQCLTRALRGQRGHLGQVFAIMALLETFDFLLKRLDTVWETSFQVM